ncbi:MAG: hypothetical protein ABFC67_00375 [Mizugakiibacter sp.]|uniref:hypothetical protein n=1 Tax=Mizugakiibacter sp. TaxID=1972610 RepID=UPI0031CC2475|nr:hypothetical protein [Xanthomonadaceae bacterium]
MKFGKVFALFGVLAALQIGSVFAADKIDVVVKGDTKDNFEAVAAAVRKQMEPGGYYQYIHGDERGLVEEKLNDMAALFENHPTIDQMSADQKRQLADDQEAINATLTQRDSRRKVCENVRPTGSNISRRVCRTYGEIESERQDARRFMQDVSNSPQLQKGG